QMQTAGTPKGQSLNAAMDALGIERGPHERLDDEAAPPAEPLKEYKRKRKFDVTPEPEGAVKEPSEKPLYMIHKHHARRLHYDLRLERGGVLVSFAVPKGLPEEPNMRRLAAHVAGPPTDYAPSQGR